MRKMWHPKSALATERCGNETGGIFMECPANGQIKMEADADPICQGSKSVTSAVELKAFGGVSVTY